MAEYFRFCRKLEVLSQTRFLEKFKPIKTIAYFSLISYLRQNPTDPIRKKEPVSALKLPPEPPVPAVPNIGLLESGEWQNLCDRLFDKCARGNRIDVPRSVLMMSKREPLSSLPRLPKTGVSERAILLLENSSPLRPVWDDFRQFAEALRNNYGSEQLQVYGVPYGPRGLWFSTAGESLNPLYIDSGQTLYMAGAFGSQTPGKIGEPWQAFIDALLERGVKVSLVSLMSDAHAPRVILDRRPLRMNTVLLAALSQVWLPTVTKLRRLRLSIPDASLADELWVYNHKDVKRVGRQLPLEPHMLLQYNEQYQKFPDALKRRISNCIDIWQTHYQGETAREAERLQQQLHNPPPLNEDAFPRLSALAVDVNDQLKHNELGPETQFFRSILPLAEALSPQVENDSSWNPLLKTSQQLALSEGRTLPWKHRDLESTESMGYLKQVGDELTVAKDGRLAVLAEPIGNRSYCSATNNIITGAFKPTQSTIEVVNNKWRYTLSALTKPTWAERFHRKPDGSLEAIHQEGTRFQRFTASKNQPESTWQLTSNRWSWASDTGIDEHGLWADLSVGQATYRLRWIPAGTFIMGSPESEIGRKNNERQHEVTLSEGYWLGETTVTQAFWQAVTGESKKGLNKPTTGISWDDCQAFIKKLTSSVKHFNAHMPTEAQWEYACRAGTLTAYWWGDQWVGSRNVYDIGEEENYPANAFGLKSMHGNTLEWCADYYGDYPVEAVWDPTGPESSQYRGQTRVQRGGSWFSGPQDLRAAYRDHVGPGDRRDVNGFRLAGGPDPQASKQRGASVTADRDEGTEDQRGGQAHPSRREF